MAWGKAGSTTLSSSGDNIEVTGMTSSKTNQFMSHQIASGAIDSYMRFNSDTSSVYSGRYSDNGAADGTVTSYGYWIAYHGNESNSRFAISDVVSISGEEKLGIVYVVEPNAAGAANAPDRKEWVGKYVPSPDADITAVSNTEGAAGSYDTDSNLLAIGSDLTPAAAIPFPTNVQVGSRAEITDTRKMYSFSDVSTDGLKAYYKFDSTSGGLVNQSTTGDGLGSNADGTNTSVTLDTTNEKIGTGCYNFDGSNDYVKLGSSVSQWNFCHEANHKWSCAFWYRSNNAPTGYEYIVGNTRASSGDRGFAIGVHTNRRLYVTVVEASNNKPLDDHLTPNNIVPDNDWHHYMLTFDATLSSENLKIYRDGSQVDTANYASWTPSGGDAGRALYLGTDKGYSTGYLDGKLDDMGIWNRVLTSNEVSFLYNSGTGATVDNAKGWQEIGT